MYVGLQRFGLFDQKYLVIFDSVQSFFSDHAAFIESFTVFAVEIDYT